MATPPNNHPWFYEIADYMRQGRMSRREFVRYAAALGVSAATAYGTAGLLRPRNVQAAAVTRGGTMKIAASVMKTQHPAQMGWGQQGNQMYQLLEHLVVVDDRSVPHPYLLESWTASEDLKTWTLNMRRGITFNNGDEFTADDVVFNFNQWLDKEIASTMRTLFAPILADNGVEKVSAYQVKLHLNKPDISVPFYLTEARGTIVNSRTFEGDILKAPHGTGPYLLEQHAAGEKASFKRRNDYWQKGVDGDPLPYLDGIEFIDMGSEGAPKMAAIRSGDIDCIDLTDVGGVEYYTSLKDVAGVTMLPSPSGFCNVMRMRADVKPFDDERVRLALKLCQHREKILGLAYHGQGLLGHDTHIFPKAAAYCPKEIPEYDPQRAKALLQQAGHVNGLDITMTIPGDVTETVRFGEILKEDAAPVGFRIFLETMPSSQYWEKWTEVGLGVTAWAHRDSDTQVLNQAYTVDQEGKPVPWNETRWVDHEFIGLLKQANGTLDVDERRKIMCKLEDIQMTRGTVGISYFANGWFCVRSKVKGIKINPQRRLIQPEMWMEASA